MCGLVSTRSSDIILCGRGTYVHGVETLVDVLERDLVRDILVDLDRALQVLWGRAHL